MVRRRTRSLAVVLLTLGGVAGALVCARPGAAAAADPAKAVDFVRDVQPILVTHCYDCHGPVTKKGDLRWDRRESVTAAAGVVVAGRPEKSALIDAVTEGAEVSMMPPPGKGRPLTKQEVAILTAWVAQGAVWPDAAAVGPDPRLTHWAFKRPERPAVPRVAAPEWVKNPVDAFILARLEKEGFRPAPEADRYTLARRVAIDLTGLPPTVEAADRFVTDASPGAYERYVDGLLASPAYGERWASVWLDLARYADSNGYANDNARSIWRWRDWVIDALNANVPYDRFTVEQLAGDLLPNATREQILATAFHRNTLSNDEGGTDNEEFRVAAVIDRVNTTMATWMGVTVACAQCHDHKYDPFSQEEYFRLYAIFNNTEDADRDDNSPLLEDPAPEAARLKTRLAELEARLAAPDAGLDAAQRRWEAALAKAPATAPAKPVAKFVRIDLPGKGRILSLAEVQVIAGGSNVAPRGKATQAGTAYDGPAKLAIDGNTDGHYFNAKSTTHTATPDDPWWELELAAAVTVDRVAIWNRTDGPGDRLAGFTVTLFDADRRPLWKQTVAEAPRPTVSLTPVPGDMTPAVIAQILKLAPDERTPKQAQELARHFRATAAEAKPIRDEIAAVTKQIAAVKPVTTPIMRELPAGKRRETRIQNRGNFLDLGAKVTPGLPAVFYKGPAAQKAESLDRLAMARWLVSPENPLTARVTVNRFWEQVFGAGLVEASEDFGVRSKPPSHPELLDYLAVTFQEGGWDVKALLKALVTSATYRQASGVPAELLARDPANVLLARGPRVRSSAEVVRDQSLHAAGLLSAKMYGPPVRPPRPKLGLKAAFGGGTDWEDSTGEDRHRRALYTQYRRTTPYPSIATFDAANRNVCTVRRARTNTPLQALVTLNDPVYVEAAQALARRAIAEGGAEVEGQITRAFRIVLTRPPTEAEVARLKALHATTLAKYAADPTAATQLATQPLGPLPRNVDAPRAAAMTVVANVLLNLDEAFAKR